MAARWTTWLLVWAVVPAALAAGCDPGPVQKVGPGDTIPDPPQTTPTGGSGVPAGDPVCDARDVDGTCKEYPGPQWDDASIVNDCAGNVEQGPCPPSDLGGCSYEPNGPLAAIVWFYSGVYYGQADVPYLSAQCYQAYGSWQ